MSKEVKRYDAQKLKVWSDETGKGFCVVEASDYDALCLELAEANADFVRIANEREALLAERDALKKDAERYRWLRQRLVGASFNWDDEGMAVLAFELPDGVSIGADCDKNIDAALQGEQK